MRPNRSGKLGMVKSAFENPDIIVEDISENKDGDTNKTRNYIKMQYRKEKRKGVIRG